MNGLTIFLCIIAGIFMISLFIRNIIVHIRFTKVINQLKALNEYNNSIIPVRSMSFEECTNVIDTVIREIYTNKYRLYYTLKETSIIPNMDKEIEKMAKEVLSAFSKTQYDQFSQYYTNEYLGQYITRQIQLLFIEYTNQNKPNVG